MKRTIVIKGEYKDEDEYAAAIAEHCKVADIVGDEFVTWAGGSKELNAKVLGSVVGLQAVIDWTDRMSVGDVASSKS